MTFPGRENDSVKVKVWFIVLYHISFTRLYNLPLPDIHASMSILAGPHFMAV